MRAIVLGSAAGGGYPQWNCRCAVCALHWQQDGRVKRRTQSSLSVSVDDENWVLFNCSPDIREQISASPFLQPRHAPRHSPISSIVLTNADIDHIGGLLSLRETQKYQVWASSAVMAQIDANPIFAVLNRDFVSFNLLEPDVKFEPVAGLTVEAFDVPGKVPLYKEGGGKISVGRNGNTLGLHIRHRGYTLSYVPGCADVDKQLLADLSATDILLFDGTLWTDDEMIASGTGSKTGRRMGHVPVSGRDGSMALLASLPAQNRVFVHINNTNPLLIDGSAERMEAELQGWLVADDGMSVTQ